MMLTEIFQLDENIDFADYHKLTHIILKEMSRENIKSPHMTPKQAKLAVNLLDYLNCKKEIRKDDLCFFEIDNLLQSRSFFSDLRL
ncbi:MAG TPA: hypothetical protein DC049_15915 [Spirochaetia bacterium]|nr:hypothetical protein [Spirochaetia bacterium]